METPIDQTMITGALRRPPSLLPWILFGVTAGLLAALGVVTLRLVSAQNHRADEQSLARANETARAQKAELALTEMKAKLEPLEQQVQALAVERDELSGRVRALSLEVAKAAAGAKSVPAAPTKPPAKKVVKKKSVPPRKRR